MTDGLTASEPETPREPLQAPDAVHESALVVVHVNVLLPPETMLAGLALRLTVGAGGAAIATVAEALAVPPAPPPQVKVNTLVAVKGPVETLPDVARAPLQAPVAVQVLTLLEVHDRVELPPEVTVVGVLAARLRDRRGGEFVR